MEPLLKPKTKLVGEFVEVIDAVPVTTVHKPAPIVGVLADKFNVDEQTVRGFPASEIVG